MIKNEITHTLMQSFNDIEKETSEEAEQAGLSLMEFVEVVINAHVFSVISNLVSSHEAYSIAFDQEAVDLAVDSFREAFQEALEAHQTNKRTLN